MDGRSPPSKRRDAANPIVERRSGRGGAGQLGNGVAGMVVRAGASCTAMVQRGDLRAYQQHPEHAEFAAWLAPLLAAKTVVDFES